MSRGVNCFRKAGVPGALVQTGALGILVLLLHAPLHAQQSFGGTLVPITVNGSAGFVIQPLKPAPSGAKPWVWYAPTIGGYPNATLKWYFDSLVTRGFWIAGIDVGESYGNPTGRKTYSAFYDTVRARFGLNPKACLFAQSRGGLMLYNWAEENGNANKISRIVGVYTVCDMRSYPGLATAAPAYAMTVAQLTAVLAQNNPIDRLAPLAAAKISILHIHGDNDNVVPLVANSQVLYDRYIKLGGPMQLIVVPGQGHAEVPEFFHVKSVLDFMLEDLKPPVSTVTTGQRNNSHLIRKLSPTYNIKGRRFGVGPLFRHRQ